MGRPRLLSLQELTWEMTMTGDTQPTRVQRATPTNRLLLILVAVLFGCSLVASIGIFGWAVFGGGNLFSRKVTSEDLEAIAIQDGDLGANIALSVIWESVDDLKRFQGTISPDALFRRQEKWCPENVSNHPQIPISPKGRYWLRGLRPEWRWLPSPRW